MTMRRERLIAFIKRHVALVTFITAFAITGATIVIISFALEPAKSPSEIIAQQNGQLNLAKVTPATADANNSSYTQTEPFPFTLVFPNDWQLYRMDASNTSAANDITYLRLLSSKAKISGQSHSGEIELSSGAMVEMTAFNSSQYKNVDDYISQVGDSALNVKSKTVAGQPAKEYQLSPEDQVNVPPKTIITLFKGNVQYTLSYTAATQSDYNANLNDFNQIVSKLTLK